MVNKFSETVRSNKNDVLLSYKKLISMLREFCVLRMESKMGKLKNLNLLKKLRRDIAAVKYYLSKNKD